MFNVDHIIASGGLLAIGFIVFAESGLLIGFLLPGDTLLFAAGVLASQHKISLWAALLTIIVSAIVGYQVGYKIGEKAGPSIFRRKDSLFFNQEYIDDAEKFFERHGGKAVILARFLAVIRTLVSVVAGMGHMDKRRYFTYNVIGAVLWGTSVTLLGFGLGSKYPGVERFLLPAVLIAMVITFSGPTIHMLRKKEVRDHLRSKFTRSKKA